MPQDHRAEKGSLIPHAQQGKVAWYFPKQYHMLASPLSPTLAQLLTNPGVLHLRQAGCTKRRRGCRERRGRWRHTHEVALEAAESDRARPGGGQPIDLFLT
jgi:hypothetical protein